MLPVPARVRACLIRSVVGVVEFVEVVGVVGVVVVDLTLILLAGVALLVR